MNDIVEIDPGGLYLCIRINGPTACYLQVNSTVWPIKMMWGSSNQFMIMDKPSMDIEEYQESLQNADYN